MGEGRGVTTCKDINRVCVREMERGGGGLGEEVVRVFIITCENVEERGVRENGGGGEL